MLTVKAFQALCGDCILVSYQSHTAPAQHIVIDAGYARTYHRTLAQDIRLLLARQERINLFILTHVDNDHIGGVIPFLTEFGTDLVDQFWLNHAPANVPILNDGPVGVKQGITLAHLLSRAGKLNAQPILAGQHYVFDQLELACFSPDADQYGRLLTKWEAQLKHPTNEPQQIAATGIDYAVAIGTLVSRPFSADTSWSNRSSIALLLTTPSFKGLFLGDAHADVVTTSLRQAGYSTHQPLPLHLLKVAHHGSRGNTNEDLLNLVDCQHYLISSNGANTHHLPHKEALARIVTAARRRRPTEPVHLYFTYDDPSLRVIFTEVELTTFAIHCHYPTKGNDALIFTHHDPS